MTIFYAVFFGFIFGFVLYKTGASNPQRIIDMLRLRDLHLMRAILLGIGSSSLLLFALIAIGIIDTGHISVKSSYVGVIIGGAILGIGWAISGFCPGTGVVAAGAGRKDALFFILGGLVGAFAYMLVYSNIASGFLFNSLGGKVTLATTGNDKFESLLPSVQPMIVAGVIAIVFISIAFLLPKAILKANNDN